MVIKDPIKAVWNPMDCDPTLLFGEATVITSSEAQREIFSASLTDVEASRAYNHSISIFFEGELNVDLLYSGLLNMLHRHEALRGTFSPDGEAFRVRQRMAFALPVLDLSKRSEEKQKTDYENFVRQELDFVFDLIHGPLFRATLIRFSSVKWTLVFNCHHIVVDGWSLKIILDDLPKLYTALVKGLEKADVPPASSFVEYLAGTVFQEKASAATTHQFWKQTFEDGIPILDLPLDHPRPRYRQYNSRREDYKLDRRIYDKLKAVGARSGVSQFVALLSAFSLFLARTTGQDDHVIGVPAAGQIKSGKAKLLGHDARLLPIRCLIEPGDTFKTFSKRVMERFFAAYENQYISLPVLLRELKIPADLGRVPFVSVMFNFDPGMKMEDFHFEGLKSSFFFNHRNFETFEISINAVVDEGDMVLECAYSTSLFDQAEMHERLVQLETLMASIADNPDLPVAQLKLLSEQQAHTMDLALNSSEMEFDHRLCVDQMIEQAVRDFPQNIAVEFQQTRLSYSDIWAQSEKIAAMVLHMGIGAKPLVGVMLDRTEAIVPVLLGIWRAGGAFVPLDPSYPADRLQYMVEHSEIHLVLTQASLISWMKGWLQVESLRYLDIADVFTPSKSPVPFPEKSLPERSSSDLAYVIYTSGSTGKPKGVKVPHRALNNFLCTMKTQAPGMSSSDRALAVTTLSFDIAELELWLPLVSGARTVIVDRATAIDGQALMKTINEKMITFIQATPATWRLLIFSGWPGNPRITGLCGGEALPVELANDILKRVGTLWNVYGPTETTVWSTLDRVGQGTHGTTVTIGRPIGNTQAYILDPHGNWVPRGVVGELWLGGEGVTAGYLNREDLTSERFVSNRFTGKGRIYKTGDLARLRADGRIEYVGRNDFQVKVRGYRIELGEVQFALAKHPSVKQCVVVVKEKSPGDAHLVAYYSLKPGQKASPSSLKTAMKGLIPDYMLPSYYMELGALPLTQNGKINVKALSEAFVDRNIEDEEFLPPRSDNEIYLARLWGELLGVTRIGRKDHFLELGGHSLLAIRAIHRIENERGVRITPKTMILHSLNQIAAEMVGEAASPALEELTVVRAKDAEIPTFFGNPLKKKFGYFYSGNGFADFGILICPPLRQEYMRTHWLIRNISKSLNRKGTPVLRFDYFGQGDSFGSQKEATLDDLCESLLDAVAELRARSAIQRIKIIAFRGSSLVVDLVQARLGSETQILLIDPVLSGRDYMNDLRSLQKRRWDVFPFHKSWITNSEHEEILGSLYARELIQDLEKLTLTHRPSVVRISSSSVPAWDDCLKIENVYLPPDLTKEIHKNLFGDTAVEDLK